LKTNANLFCQVPVAQKRYTCEPIVNKRHLIALFSARLTGKQNTIVDFCQSNVIKWTFGMETGEEVYQKLTPVGPVRNIMYRLAEQQRSNDDAMLRK
jgi:hypothetical protein